MLNSKFMQCFAVFLLIYAPSSFAVFEVTGIEPSVDFGTLFPPIPRQRDVQIICVYNSDTNQDDYTVKVEGEHDDNDNDNFNLERVGGTELIRYRVQWRANNNGNSYQTLPSNTPIQFTGALHVLNCVGPGIRNRDKPKLRIQINPAWFVPTPSAGVYRD